MARVLLTWELGGGLGHLGNLYFLASNFVRRGHYVSMALRDLPRAQVFFGELPVDYFQAPFRPEVPINTVAVPATYADLLYNVGFGDAGELRELVERWLTIFSESQPDLIICEHSPTALLAARQSDLPRIVCGAGFFCPPAGELLPVLRPWRVGQRQALVDSETRVLERTNLALAGLGSRPLARLSELYSDVSADLLLTFPEMDHFGPRTANYWGPWFWSKGVACEWPQGDRPRVFAYLKPSRGLESLFSALNRLRLSSLVSCDGIPLKQQAQFHSNTLRFTDSPVDVRKVSEECDIAITNANQATLGAILLSGKPLLMLPLHLEQYLLPCGYRSRVWES